MSIVIPDTGKNTQKTTIIETVQRHQRVSPLMQKHQQQNVPIHEQQFISEETYTPSQQPVQQEYATPQYTQPIQQPFQQVQQSVQQPVQQVQQPVQQVQQPVQEVVIPQTQPFQGGNNTTSGVNLTVTEMKAPIYVQTQQDNVQIPAKTVNSNDISLDISNILLLNDKTTLQGVLNRLNYAIKVTEAKLLVVEAEEKVRNGEVK